MKQFLPLNLQFFSEDPSVKPTPVVGDKTFTQDEVNRIVSDRLNKEKGKINADREAAYTQKEQELNKRELQLHARETLSERNMPGELLDVLNYTDQESLDKSIDVIEQVIKQYQQSTQEPQSEPQDKPVPMITLPTKGSMVSGSDPIRSAWGLK